MAALPSLRQLRYLVTVAETLHFGKAAERCFVTQSTLSAGIQDLETLLGVTLIERHGRKQVVITSLGEQIITRARALLADAEALVEAAQAGAHPLAGELRLGVIPTIGPYVLPRLVPSARRAYPDLRLYLREEQSARLLTELTEGRVDAGLLALPYEIGDLASVDLWSEDVVAALPADHPLTARDRLNDADLRGATLLMLEDGHCLRGHALEACGLSGPRGGEAFQATSLPTLVQMVAGGLGITLLPRSAVPVEVSAGSGVTIRELAASRPARTISLIWRRTSPRGRDFRLLAKLLKSHPPPGVKVVDGPTGPSPNGERVP